MSEQPEIKLLIRPKIFRRMTGCGFFDSKTKEILLDAARLYERAIRQKMDFVDKLCQIINHEVCHFYFSDYDYNHKTRYFSIEEEIIACYFSFQDNHPEFSKYLGKGFHRVCMILSLQPKKDMPEQYLIFIARKKRGWFLHFNFGKR